MSDRYIMTAFGVDRVGIVADVTRVLYENDCNLEDTTMSLLADEFTLSMLFSSSREGLEEILNRECRRLELEKGISAFIRPLAERNGPDNGSVTTCTLHIEGLDQAGMVYKTSRFLSQNSLNILNLNSSARPSPQSGATMYNMDIQIETPAELTMEQFEDSLAQVADELQVDISMSSR